MLVVQSIRWLDAKRIVVFRFLPPTPLTIHPPSSLFFSARLLLVAVQGAASLGVEELVPDVIVSVPFNASLPIGDPAVPGNIH